MDYDSIEDLASGKWHASTWGETKEMTSLEKKILKTAEKLEVLVKVYMKIDEEATETDFKEVFKTSWWDKTKAFFKREVE